MQRRASLDLTEKLIASAMGDEEDQNSRRCAACTQTAPQVRPMDDLG
jgi:hypothetical protein